MAHPAETTDIAMEQANIPGTSLKVSRVASAPGLSVAGCGVELRRRESIATIRAALDHGINVIDTAPAYGFGRSEEIVGKAIADGRLRTRVLIATKTGLEWMTEEYPAMQAGRGSCRRSTIRCGGFEPITSTSTRFTGRIRWHRSRKPLKRCVRCSEQGKIRAIGVSNFSVEPDGAIPPRRAAACAATAV